MKLAVSNIAWPSALRDDAYRLLGRKGISGLEIAPGLFLDGAADPFEPSPAELAAALDPLQAAGLELVSMQSLLFGVSGAALFGSAAERAVFAEAMLRAIGLAGTLGVPNLVFGSPRQRTIPPVMDRAVAEAIALETFRRLGDAASAVGARLALEPNAPDYGTNFLNRVEETAAFVRRVDHPAVVLNFDLGALHAQGDFARLESIVAATADCTGHVHFSEPALAPAPADSAAAARAFAAIRRSGYLGWYSIEMTATPAPLDDLAAAIDRLTRAAQQSRVTAPAPVPAPQEGRNSDDPA